MFKILLVLIAFFPLLPVYAVSLGSPLITNEQYAIECDEGGSEIFIFNEDYTENAEGRCNGDLAPASQPSWYSAITGTLFSISTPGTYHWEIYDATGTVTTETFSVLFNAPEPPPPEISTTSPISRLADASEVFVLSWYFLIGYLLVLSTAVIFANRIKYDY